MVMSLPSIIDQVGFLLPVGLQEDAVDVVDVDGLGGGADGLDQAADAEVAGLAQDAVGDAHLMDMANLRKLRLLFEDFRSASKTIDIDNVNRVLLQPHWQKEADLVDF